MARFTYYPATKIFKRFSRTRKLKSRYTDRQQNCVAKMAASATVIRDVIVVTRKCNVTEMTLKQTTVSRVNVGGGGKWHDGRYQAVKEEKWLVTVTERRWVLNGIIGGIRLLLKKVAATVTWWWTVRNGLMGGIVESRGSYGPLTTSCTPQSRQPGMRFSTSTTV